MTAAKTNERPGTRAKVSHVHASAYKAREVLNLIRGKSYAEASEILDFSERDISRDVKKVLDSAVANAEHNDGQIAEELFVAACYADEGPTLKRFRPRARGRASRIRKRTCHITVIVSRFADAELEQLRERESASGRSGSTQAADARRTRVERSKARADAKAAAAEAEQDHDDHEGHDHEDHDHEDHDHVGQGQQSAPEELVEGLVLNPEGPYGPMSAEPLDDGSAPDGFEIKGNNDSMKYHQPDGRWYEKTVAEVYFATAEAAEDAGFTEAGATAADTEADTDSDSADDGADTDEES